MSNTITQQPNRVSDLVSLVRMHWKLLVIPLALCTLAAAWFALKPKMWQATQTLQVRDDLIGESFYKPGRFDSLDSMKTAQETILHTVTDFGVVKNAMETVGPPRGNNKNWLEGKSGARKVEDLRDRISLVAPNGAEFGTTEVIILQVKSTSPERSAELVTALLDEIEDKLRNLRCQRLQSMEAELGKSLALTEKDYRSFSQEMRQMEKEVGNDLPTLISMISNGHSSNDIKVALENLRITKRSAEDDYQEVTSLLNAMETTVDNPESIVAMPDKLLEKQPALKRLKDGLVDSQLRLSTLRGQYQDAHPGVIEARYAVDATEAQIRQELTVSLSSLRDQESIQKGRVDRLEREQRSLEERLAKLAKSRVRYATLSSQSKKLNDELAAASHKFTSIKSQRSAAPEASMVIRNDDGPYVEGRPLGPGRTSILGSGILGGLLIGLGLITFFAGPSLPVVQGPANPMGPAPQSEALGHTSEQPNQQQFVQSENDSTNSVADPRNQQRTIATTVPLPAPTVTRTLAETDLDAAHSTPPVVDSRTPQSFSDEQFRDEQSTAVESTSGDTIPYEDQRTDSVFSGSQFTDELDESLDTGRIVAEDQPQWQQETQFDSEAQGSTPGESQSFAADSMPSSYQAPLRPVQAVRNLESNQPPAYEAVLEDVGTSSEFQQSNPHEQPENFNPFESSVSNVYSVDDLDPSTPEETASTSEEQINSETVMEETAHEIEDFYNRSSDDSMSPSTEPDNRITSNTIDLNTLRAELGASPIDHDEMLSSESAQVDPNPYDFDSHQDGVEQQDQSETVEDSTLEPLESLHEKIKELTDPSRLDRPESDTIES